MVFSTNSTLLSVDALLGATVCAATRDTVSSERHIARERADEAMVLVAASEGRYGVQPMRFKLDVEQTQRALYAVEEGTLT